MRNLSFLLPPRTLNLLQHIGRATSLDNYILLLEISLHILVIYVQFGQCMVHIQVLLDVCLLWTLTYIPLVLWIIVVSPISCFKFFSHTFTGRDALLVASSVFKLKRIDLLTGWDLDGYRSVAQNNSVYTSFHAVTRSALFSYCFISPSASAIFAHGSLCRYVGQVDVTVLPAAASL